MGYTDDAIELNMLAYTIFAYFWRIVIIFILRRIGNIVAMLRQTVNVIKTKRSPIGHTTLLKHLQEINKLEQSFEYTSKLTN